MISYLATTARAATLACLCAGFFGCVQVGPKDLRLAGPAPVQNPVIGPKPCLCTLPPIPQVVHITIEPGKPVEADEGGKSLLRAYVKARESGRAL
jgi:hypothetical protein